MSDSNRLLSRVLRWGQSDSVPVPGRTQGVSIFSEKESQTVLRTLIRMLQRSNGAAHCSSAPSRVHFIAARVEIRTNPIFRRGERAAASGHRRSVC